eukprot:PhF_6_TR25539/c0_g1_i1/m.35822
MSKVFSVVAVLAVLVHIIAGQQQEVLFGQSAAFTGGVWEPAGRYDAGLLAAFKEVNDVGGVNGRLMRLISYDDQYIVSNIKPNFDKLMQIPNLFIFVSFMGSGTVAAAYALASAAGIPIVAPLTGSAVFRRTFSPYAIHLRSGYDDEALAMLRLFIEQHRFRRLVVIYQNDSFGIPSKDMIVQTLEKLGMSLVGLHVYNRADIPLENFTQRALNVTAQDPQGVILYTVEGFSNPFFEAFYALNPNSTVKFVTGSWIGDGNTNLFRKKGYKPENLYVTQVTPHPLSTTSDVARKYRAALDAYEGASTQAYDYLSIEGYMTGRLVIEMMKRTRELTRQSFMDAVFGTHMFEIDELLVGPYSNDCRHPQPAVGRSSMCNCTQGLRFVSTTVLDANYGYKVSSPDLTYSMTECYATSDVVSRPAVFAFPGSVVPPSIAAGMSLVPKISAGIIPVPLNHSKSLTGDQIYFVGNGTSLMGSFGAAPVEDTPAYLVLSGITSGAIHSEQMQEFRKMSLFIVPTINQEIFAITSALVGEVTILIGSAVDLSIPLNTLITDSVRTHGNKATVSYAFFTDEVSLAGNLRNSKSMVVVIGMAGPLYLKAVVDELVQSTSKYVHVMFSEACSSWSAVEGSSNITQPALNRLIIASNFPLWSTPGKSQFAQQYQTATSSLSKTLRLHPWTLVGYTAARMIDYLVLRANTPTAPSIIEALYKFSVVSIDDESFGPFVNQQCSEASCSCNAGVRIMRFYSVSDILFGRNSDVSVIPDVRFGSCTIAYTPEEPPVDHTLTIVIAVVVPIVVIIFVIMLVVPRYLAYAKTKFAPKDPTKKFCTMFIALKKESVLWERFPSGMPIVLNKVNTILTKCIHENRCYKVKNVGAATMVVSENPQDLIQCAGAAAAELEKTVWTGLLGEEAQEVEIIAQAVKQRGDVLATSASRGSRGSQSVRSRSMSHSRTQSMSQSHSRSMNQSVHSVSSRSLPVVLRVEFGIGLNMDVGRINVDDRGVYDYSGPCTDGAAIASDYAQGHQILLTGPFWAAHTSLDKTLTVPYATVKFGTKDVELIQYNVPGLEVRKFEYREDDQAVDSIAATLQQQNSGVMSKKATVLTIHTGAVDPSKYTLDEWGDLYKTYVDGIHECVSKGKGCVHAYMGGRVITSFNAVAPTPQAAKRAYQALIAISELYDTTVTASIAVDTAIVGAFKVKSEDGKTVNTFNSVGTKALDVATHIQTRIQHRFGEAVMTAIPASLEDEFSTFAVLEFVDIVRLPTTKTVTGVIAVRGLKEVGAADEWMYELEEGDKTDPYRLLNEWFKRVLSYKPYSQSLKQYEHEIRGEAEKVPIVTKTTGFHVLLEIFEAGSVENYLGKP